MALVTTFTIVNWLVSIPQCTLFDAILHPVKYSYTACINRFVVLMVPFVLVCATESSINFDPPHGSRISSPISSSWRSLFPLLVALQASRRRKVMVLAIICFLSFSVITALCRFIALKGLAIDPDTSTILGRIAIVAGIEIEVTGVAVSLSAMKSLFLTLSGSSYEASLCFSQPRQRRGDRPDPGIYMVQSTWTDVWSGMRGICGPCVWTEVVQGVDRYWNLECWCRNAPNKGEPLPNSGGTRQDDCVCKVQRVSLGIVYNRVNRHLTEG
ncbi:hypothetical protein ETB97_008740 [Aspergillus alliaceus]|uniref:Rhodopsin domain-containing protein n=1 Tax=Petromyces alliaceus TaxID=209559 RepID=A0A8H6AFD3_PETAA|nr:hypothetical protein ETB97_008740 [Aspergillus burnettii]